MPQSYQEYSSGLTATTYSVTFKYLTIDDVHALGFDGSTWTSLALHASTPRDATNKTITLAAAPSSYTKIRLYRATSNTTLVDFQNGSRLSEADLDTAYQQGLFVAQEVAEDANTNQFNAVRDSSILTGTNLSNFANQAFTATSGQTEFTLTNFIPQTTAPEAFVVSIDGVIQAPSAYTISMSPAKITFSSGVPLSAIVVVVTGVAAASATSVDDSTLEIVTATNKARVKDGGITPAKLSTTGEYTVAGLTVDNGSNDGGQLRLNSQGYNQMYFDNYNGDLRVINHDLATTSGREVTRIKSSGTIQQTGNETIDGQGNTSLSLQASSNAGVDAKLALGVITGNTPFIAAIAGSGSAANPDITFRTNNQEALRLDTNGRLVLKNLDEVRLFTTDDLYSGMKIGGNTSGEGAFKVQYNRSTANAGFYNGLNSATEVIHISSSGAVMVGGTDSSPYNNTSGSGNSTFASDGAIYAGRNQNVPMAINNFGNTAGGTYRDLIHLYVNGVTRGKIQANTNGQVFVLNSSDYRLKEDIIDIESSIEKTKQLNPVNFAWKESGDRVDGFIAHELQEVCPDAVSGTKDAVDDEGNPEYQGIDQSKLVPLLTKALQEAVTKIESLEARVEELESSQTKIESLEARVEALENA